MNLNGGAIYSEGMALAFILALALALVVLVFELMVLMWLVSVSGGGFQRWC